MTKRTARETGKMLRDLRIRAGVSQRLLADTLGFKSQSGITRYEQGQRGKDVYLPPWMILKLVAALKGKGDPPITIAEIYALGGEGPQNWSFLPDTLSPGVVLIDGKEHAIVPVFDDNMREDHPMGFHVIEKQWLDPLTRAAPDFLAILPVQDDSMCDALLSGDWVVIDRTQTDPGRPGIFAIRVGTNTWFRRIVTSPVNDRAKLIADNGRYPTEEIDRTDLNIIGRLVCLVFRSID